MNARQVTLNGFWAIADILRNWLPSDSAAECPATFFFLKRFTDLAAATQLEDLTAHKLPKHLTTQFQNFTWANFAKNRDAVKSLLSLLQDIESVIPELKGLSTDTKLAQILSGRRDNDAHLQFLFSALDAIPVGKLSKSEASAVFQDILDSMADRAASSVTPRSVRALLVSLLSPKAGESIYDPVCGYASLLCEAASSIAQGTNAFLLSGQELNPGTLVLAKMNTILGGWDADLRSGDTLIAPQHNARGALQKFDVILANPPFGLRLRPEGIVRDEHNRFLPVAPSSSELAFVQHVVHSLSPKGRAAILVPNGILSRGGNDHTVRKHLVETNRIEAVVSLPPYLFPGTPISVSVLVLRGEKIGERSVPIAFMDMGSFAEGPTTRRQLTGRGASDAGAFLRNRVVQKGISALIPPGEVAGNDFNLSVQRYVRAVTDDGLAPFADELSLFVDSINKRNQAEDEAIDLVRSLKKGETK